MPKKRLLLQAGHVAPREIGFESGTGTSGEQTLVHPIEHELIQLLDRDGRFNVTHSHGDVPDGWKGDLFLALHGDGSADPEASGFSFGYPPGCSECKRLADTFAAWYEQIPGAPKRRSDNYTDALSGYYGWRRTDAPAKLLVEHGFLSNPGERTWLFGNVAAIAQAHFEAILHYFGLELQPPANFWAWARWYRGHGEYRSYGGPRKGPRPNVPRRIPLAWWGRLRRNLGRPA